MPFSDLGVFLGDFSLAQIKRVTKDPMKAQKKTLKKIIRKNRNCELGKKYDFKNIKSIKDYQTKVPLTTYADYEPYADGMIAKKYGKNPMFSGWNSRYCSSSGSVGKPKILPKSVKDLWNMQCVGFSCTAAVAFHYLKRKKGIRLPAQMGPLVVVLNGHKLADGKWCHGAGQVPLTYLKGILPTFCTSPNSLLFPEHEELIDISYFQLRFALENRKVTYLGSVVVTLLTTAFEYLEENWELLCDDIEKGTINPNIRATPELRGKYSKKFKPNPKRAAELRREFEKGFDDPIAPRIWPRLTWGYGMMGANLKVYVEKLRKYIGYDVPLHNMGYAAAEGFFAMPTELDADDAVLLPHFIFFEFLPVDDDAEDPDGSVKPLLISDLEIGKKYEIVVSNFSGLYRYRIEDVVLVTRKYNETPCVELMYRRNLGLNVANEKTTTEMIDSAARETAKEMNAEFAGHSFYADYSTNPPRYCMLAEVEGPAVPEEERQKYIDVLDRKMKEINEKYVKYRRWGMLNRPEVLFLKEKTYRNYNEYLRSKGVVLNQIKPVTIINSDERRDFFFSRVETDSDLVRQIKKGAEKNGVQ